MNNPTGDSLMGFGFVAGFFTIVLLAYRRQLRTSLPLIAMGMSCCTVYGFLSSVWPLGFVLLAVTAAEFSRWWHAFGRQPAPLVNRFYEPQRRDNNQSRIRRMFGRA
jgi:hypothetical protein